MPPKQLRVLLVTNGAEDRQVGGYAMRCAGLVQGLSMVTALTTVAVRCPDPALCSHRQPESIPFVEPVEIQPPRPRLPPADPCGGYFCPRAGDELREQVLRDRPDVIVVSGLELFRYLDLLGDVADGALVADLHNVESALWEESGRVGAETTERPAGPWKALDLQAVEAAVASLATGVWVCTEDDRRRFLSVHELSADRVAVVPNVVPVPDEVRPMGAVRRLLFPGRLDYLPNVLAAHHLLDEICPRLGQALPGLGVVIAGARPGMSLLERRYPDNARLTADPATMDPLWPGAVLVVPLVTGGGSRLKILEAFARGCPVVSSPKGIEGIDATAGVHYLLARSPQETVESIVRLINNPELVTDLVTAAHLFVANRYTARQVAECAMAALEHLTAARGASAAERRADAEPVPEQRPGPDETGRGGGPRRRSAGVASRDWFLPLAGDSGVPVFAFPHAGAGAGRLLEFARAVASQASLWAANLPRRQARLDEPFPPDLASLVGELADAVTPLVRERYGFFGYCAGALLAFLVARELRERDVPLPDTLVVASFEAPDIARLPRDVADLPASRLWRRLVDSGGLPVAPDARLREVAEPAVRADFALLADYVHRPAEPLPVPIDVCFGVTDTTPRGALLGWRRQTTADVRLHCLPGGHWLLDDSLAELATTVMEITTRQAGTTSRRVGEEHHTA
ncbi:glycosyltransferase [Nonomuraea sp. KC401]|uniref:thioesterase domain-containing protein n=1 Tax=unclassified Nonomuraea TaxID=2593643 RepID=UPI0010FDC413|nr:MULTISPECIES: thioesterase domain-containing protein [unclassified Nonomuraea]NBE98015.1 glycosyltransferase [Nonomuraea sp. K271]TLF60033.1 glycosyltransferase [Nonomuraea sp. KC401]